MVYRVEILIAQGVPKNMMNIGMCNLMNAKSFNNSTL